MARGSSFDRVRPREAVRPGGAGSYDPEGKRALFSATAPVSSRPGPGSVVIDCSECLGHSVLSPLQGLRAVFPSVVLGLRLAHGESARSIGVRARGWSAWMRCPACQQRRWVRLTLTV